MLAVALADNNACYWEVETTKPPSLKCKRPQAEEESLDNSVSMVKTAMSVKKTPKSALKGSPSTNTKKHFTNDSQTVTSQVTTILQLTEMVLAVQQENKMIMTHFDQLTEQITALISQSKISTNQCPLEAMEDLAGQQDELVQPGQG